MVADIFDRQNAETDLRRDWSSRPPRWYRNIGLSGHELRKLQDLSLFLRNRRIVSGYELLDRALRARLSPDSTDAVPPTWLTVGKWTAKVIGDLIGDRIALPDRERTIRMVVRYLLVHLFGSRTIPMSRILVMGNRVIFSQVGSLIAELLNIDFEGDHNLRYPQFVFQYGDQLQGAADETAGHMIRNPLSDSMLRAAHAYYRAMGPSSDQDTWILVGNLYLAAYEQHIAQLFVDKSLSYHPRHVVKQMFKHPGSHASWHKETTGSGLLDMGLEGLLPGRLLNILAASFATRFILSFRVGNSSSKPSRRNEERMTLAPAYPLDQAQLCIGVDKYVHSLPDPHSYAAERLKAVWSALDYADGDADRTPVRDWRNFTYRVNYIANLFVISQLEPNRRIFLEPVLEEAEMKEFLSGELPRRFGVRLNRKQQRQWQAAAIAHDKETIVQQSQ